MSEKKYDNETLKAFYQTMARIREFESRAADCFTKGMLAGNIHLCLGQEAVAAGTCAALEPEDYITCTHRGHGQCIAKGGDTKKMMAELFGKETGYCHGKGGSMHIADAQGLHSLGANGIVGGGLAIATGSALASVISGDHHVSLCFFGDGASNQGVFHEVVNMAATWNLPVIYLCENNGYAVSTPIHTVTHTTNIAARAKAYDIPSETVDGMDVLAVYEAVQRAANRAREGKGPTLVECLTYRYQGHYCGDPAPYRPKEYLEEGMAHDALKHMVKVLLDNGVKQSEIDAIDAAAKKELDDAIQFSIDSPDPDPSEVTTDVYADDNERSVVR